jgi:two-component system response regulator GlrR
MVVFTPTLVKRGPGPRTWVIGNLDQTEVLIDLLDVNGVDRRRDA